MEREGNMMSYLSSILNKLKILAGTDVLLYKELTGSVEHTSKMEAQSMLAFVTKLEDRCDELKDLHRSQFERIKDLEECIKNITSNPLIKLLRRIKCLKIGSYSHQM